MMLTQLKKDLSSLANLEKAKFFSRFFKTGKGEYGEGDKFIGVTVPNMRLVATRFQGVTLKELQELLNSKIHEHRFTALIILVNKYRKSDEKEKKEIVNFYLKNTRNINNWDSVDLSAAYILGEYYLYKDKAILYKFARSKNLWERRIAIIATSWFIRNKKFADTLKITEILLKDQHDLIHKACGWMLREVGKKDLKTEEEFLVKYHKIMPRTMLRYAIEKFPEEKRKRYLA